MIMHNYSYKILFLLGGEKLINYEELIWESDCNGNELGFPQISVVGVYRKKNSSDKLIYIDIENDLVIERRGTIASK